MPKYERSVRTDRPTLRNFFRFLTRKKISGALKQNHRFIEKTALARIVKARRGAAEGPKLETILRRFAYVHFLRAVLIPPGKRRFRYINSVIVGKF